MAEFVSNINEEIYISGLFNMNGIFIKKGKDIHFVGEIESIKKRGIKQIMNFGAIKFFTTLSGGNPVKAVGTSNFYYGKIGMRITLFNDKLTIEGLLGERGNRQYLIKGRFLRNSINLTIDKTSNTIKLSDLKKRIKAAIRRTKSGVNLSF